MSPTLTLGGCALVSYLLGAVPFGLIVARARGIDIREAGSGNIGATNVFRIVGKSWGVLTFVCDALKGFLPAFCFPLLPLWQDGAPGPVTVAVVCGCLAVVGHVYPVYLKFKGGKGIATSAGALLGMAPAAVGIGLAVWAAVTFSTRYVSLGSVSAAVAIAVAAWLLYGSDNLLVPWALTVLAVLAIWRHRGNIRRLLNGTEHRFGQKKAGGADE